MKYIVLASILTGFSIAANATQNTGATVHCLNGATVEDATTKMNEDLAIITNRGKVTPIKAWGSTDALQLLNPKNFSASTFTTNKSGETVICVTISQ